MLDHLGPRINDAIVSLAVLERRFDPYFRDIFNALLQRPLAELTQILLRFSHSNPETRLCQEIPIPGEEEIAREITQQMARFILREYRGKIAERAGNTKTYGVVKAEFQVLDGLPARLRKGILSVPRSFPAWIRFSGPGPLSPPDIADAGIISIGIKLWNVPGKKLLPDEKGTQDFLGVSSPSFVVPNIVENLKLQREAYARTPLFYFLNPLDSHYLDAIMQALYSRLNSSPLEVRYWSCVPYLLGNGTAIKYSVRPTSEEKTRIPWDPPGDWLRQAMARTLSRRDAEFDFMVQVQTDYRMMPIEDASIEWPEWLSPFVPVARIRIPRQEFRTSDRTLLARQLCFNPWHSIAEHRPLGNQNRARKAIYFELSALRQRMNSETHVEPGIGEVEEAHVGLRRPRVRRAQTLSASGAAAGQD